MKCYFELNFSIFALMKVQLKMHEMPIWAVLDSDYRVQEIALVGMRLLDFAEQRNSHSQRCDGLQHSVFALLLRPSYETATPSASRRRVPARAKRTNLHVFIAIIYVWMFV